MHDGMLDAGLLCTLQRIDPLTGADDEDDLAIRDLTTMLCIDQCLEVGTTAADQHGNSSFCVHLFSSYVERDIKSDDVRPPGASPGFRGQRHI